MNDLRKLGRTTSTSKVELPLTKRRPTPTKSPRNPLKDLNTPTTTLNRSSTSSIPHPTPKHHQPKTPKSAPPNPRTHPSTRPKPNPSNPRSYKDPPKPSEINRVLVPKSNRFFRNGDRMASRVDSEVGSRKKPDLCGVPSLSRAMSKCAGSRSMRNGSKEGSFKGRTIRGAESEVGFRERFDLIGVQSTPEKGGEKQKGALEKTGGAATTPPIHSSISPEITCSAVPTPACFAAGHLIAGIPDRRKCRPRGILKVGEDCKEVEIGGGLSSEVPNSEGGGFHETPPLAKASMRWIPSPRGEDPVSGSSLERGGKVSLNWAVHPCEGGSDFEGSPLSTDLDVVEMWRSPSSGSSISPFSMILKKATATFSSSEALRQQMENLQTWQELSSGSKVVCTPSSRLRSKMQDCTPQAHEEEGMCEIIKIPVSFSPERRGNSRSGLRLRASSFQFGCPAVSADSVDLETFRQSPHVADAVKQMLAGEGLLRDSAKRISWREGLLSQIYDTQESIDHDKKDVLDPEMDSESCPSGHSGGNGFGSIEYISEPQVVEHQMGGKKMPPQIVQCKESLSIDSDSDMFVSCSDSDWRMFFRNNLFES